MINNIFTYYERFKTPFFYLECTKDLSYTTGEFTSFSEALNQPPDLSRPTAKAMVKPSVTCHSEKIQKTMKHNHRENGGTLGMVPLIINPIYILYSGYFLGISPFKGLLGAYTARVPPKSTTIFPMTQGFSSGGCQ